MQRAPDSSEKALMTTVRKADRLSSWIAVSIQQLKIKYFTQGVDRSYNVKGEQILDLHVSGG